MLSKNALHVLFNLFVFKNKCKCLVDFIGVIMLTVVCLQV